jgi:glycosyltransferase involved in cell wall biosynthesis
MSAAPRVSVLMLTYNRPQFISRAIASVVSQTVTDWELLVVQDGSNAATVDILRDWTARDPRILHLARGTKGSIAEASNYGLARARGRYIAILDDDDYWVAPDKLARQIDYLDGHPDFVACGGGYILVDRDTRECGRFYKPQTDDQIRARALLANPIGNSTSMFRRLLPDGRPALYDESLRGFADWDFWLMMGRAGKLHNIPEHLACYALWEGGGSFEQSRVNTRAALRIVRKHRDAYPGYAAALALAYAQYWYTFLPASVRRVSYTALSSLKKSLSSARP